MSAVDPKKETGSTTPKKDPIKIDVNVDSEQMKKLLSDLAKKEKESEDLAKQLKEAQDAKKTAETSLEEKTTEADDYKTKLALIAEAKLNAKRKVIMDKAKEVIKDEERLKKIEEGMEDAKGVQATEFMIETLSKTLEEGKKQHEELVAKEKFETDRNALLTEFPEAKEQIEKIETVEDLEELSKELKPEGTGEGAGEGTGTGEKAGTPTKKSTIPAGQIPFSGATSKTGSGYDSYQAMIQDLRKMEHSDNPEEAAYAKAVLDEMFRKWSVAVKKRYEGKSKGFTIDPEIDEELKQPKLKDITKLSKKERR